MIENPDPLDKALGWLERITYWPSLVSRGLMIYFIFALPFTLFVMRFAEADQSVAGNFAVYGLVGYLVIWFNIQLEYYRMEFPTKRR